MPVPMALDRNNVLRQDLNSLNETELSSLRFEILTKAELTPGAAFFSIGTNASEMAKVLENSFRAMNIAFIQEWTEYAHRADVDLFDIIETIRVRSTHKNIMYPGFGVGGYCLTKDALLANWSNKNLFESGKNMSMSINAIKVNDLMPEYSFQKIKEIVPTLKGRKITILGVSYLNDVADTRCSPTELFYDLCIQEGAEIILHDPIVEYWEEKKIEIDIALEKMKEKEHEILVFAVKHKEYINLTSERLLSLFRGAKIILDANNIINDNLAQELIEQGVQLIGVGKGHWQRFRRNNNG